MNTGEYIESGILESYVLGMLSHDENAEVDAMAARYPEVKAAILELEKTMEELGQAYSVAPDPALKENILQAAFAEVPDSAEDPIRTLKSNDPAPKDRSSRSTLSFLAIAASVVLLLSLGINIMQYFALQRMEDELQSTQMRIAELESENQVMVANYKEVVQDISVLRDPHTATFIMKAVEGRDPAYNANVYWNATTEIAYLDVKQLPEAPAGKQYQLWAIKDGKPMGMAVFNAGDTQAGLMEMGHVHGADAFAVTLENAGGAPSPTMEEMYVYGTPVQG